ncbi:MAG: hypothetical protein ABI425_03015 [Patescibacteria group bacterium]
MKRSDQQGGLFDDPVLDQAVAKPSTIRPSTPVSLGSLLQKYQPKEKNKYVSREFQDYGYRLAMELGDEGHKSLYIRLAKTVERGLLESARSFVIDSQAKSKAKLFMWKLKELKAAKVSKKSDV